MTFNQTCTRRWYERFNSKVSILFGVLIFLLFTMIAPLVLIYFTASYELSVESVITAGEGNSIGFDKKILQQSLWQASLLLFFIAAVFSWFATLVLDRYRRVQQMQHHQVQSLKAEIAALSEADKALQEAKQIAESANQAKSRYLSGISHELRSPLNSLLGYAQLIEKDHQLSDKNRDSVRIIRRSGEYLADLIEGLLDISKIEAGRLEILPTEVQFPALLEQIVSMFQLQADKKGIEFSYNFSHRLPEYVRVDEKQLRQILINLLSNAIKFTAEGYVCFNVDYKSETAIFTVEDSGRGIAEEDQERVFSPFEQVHNQNFSYVPGTGLGLTITRLLTEIMGGDITLTSELGKGSVFRVQLLMGSVIEPKLMSISEKDIEGYHGDKKLLMVVDDDPIHRQMMRNILEPTGFTITEADNAMACLALSEQYLPDLFMLDVSMPGMNGLELARALRDKGIKKPIIFISANVREGEAVQHEDYGQDDYLLKPINIGYLFERIGAILNLEWRYAKSATALSSIDAAVFVDKDYPPLSDILTLKRMVDIEYEQGLAEKINRLEELTLASPGFIRHMRDLLVRRQFTEMSHLLDR